MEILKPQPRTKAPAETFTGDPLYDVVVRGEEPSRVRVNVVYQVCEAQYAAAPRASRL